MSNFPVAIVTGGARGLGAAISVLLLKKGYQVCIADIQEERGKKFVEEQQSIYGENKIIFSVCDVSKEKDFKDVFDRTVEEFGQVDLVINNAGIVLEQNPQRCIDVNLIGPIIGCNMALEYMGKSNGGKGGMVINTASLAGVIKFPFAPVYSASKHGIVGLTRSYGDEYHFAKHGVIFTALCPSFIHTEIFENITSVTLTPDIDLRDVGVGLFMSPEYVAEGVAKLLEDKINGSTLLVNKSNGFQYVNAPDIPY